MKRKGKVLMEITKHMITAFRNFVFRFEGYHAPHIIRCFFSSFCLHLINEIPTSYIFFSTVRILFNDNLVWNNFSLQFKRSNPKRNTSLMMTVLFKFIYLQFSMPVLPCSQRFYFVECNLKYFFAISELSTHNFLNILIAMPWKLRRWKDWMFYFRRHK